jgi:uncharacterized protein with PIN domain
MKCPKCREEVDFKHLHDTAHGIPETHMQGSERYVCPECQHTIWKNEGEKLGLKFILD